MCFSTLNTQKFSIRLNINTTQLDYMIWKNKKIKCKNRIYYNITY